MLVNTRQSLITNLLVGFVVIILTLVIVVYTVILRGITSSKMLHNSSGTTFGTRMFCAVGVVKNLLYWRMIVDWKARLPLLNRTDEALYRAKEEGRNGIRSS